jgi:hypothetical protein
MWSYTSTSPLLKLEEKNPVGHHSNKVTKPQWDISQVWWQNSCILTLKLGDINPVCYHSYYVKILWTITQITWQKSSRISLKWGDDDRIWEKCCRRKFKVLCGDCFAFVYSVTGLCRWCSCCPVAAHWRLIGVESHRPNGEWTDLQGLWSWPVA